MKPTLLVLAAGMGSRYGGLKQIDPVGPSGETIIDYSIYDAIRAGFGKLVFIIRRDIEQDFRESIGSKFEARLPVEYAFQELDALPKGFSVPEGRVKPWGTAHAVMMAEENIAEPFAVINADDFYGRDAFRVLSDYLQTSVDGDVAEYSMVGFILRNTLSDFGSVARGICATDADGYLQSIVEVTNIEQANGGATSAHPDFPTLSGDEIVSMNMWGFTPSFFSYAKAQFADFLANRIEEPKSEFYIPTVVNNVIESGEARVKVLESTASWFGVTYREDKPHVIKSIRQLVDAGEYPEALWA